MPLRVPALPRHHAGPEALTRRAGVARDDGLRCKDPVGSAGPVATARAAAAGLEHRSGAQRPIDQLRLAGARPDSARRTARRWQRGGSPQCRERRLRAPRGRPATLPARGRTPECRPWPSGPNLEIGARCIADVFARLAAHIGRLVRPVAGGGRRVVRRAGPVCRVCERAAPRPQVAERFVACRRRRRGPQARRHPDRDRGRRHATSCHHRHRLERAAL